MAIVNSDPNLISHRFESGCGIRKVYLKILSIDYYSLIIIYLSDINQTHVRNPILRNEPNKSFVINKSTSLTHDKNNLVRRYSERQSQDQEGRGQSCQPLELGPRVAMPIGFTTSANVFD
jgi:hypothetical protein